MCNQVIDIWEKMIAIQFRNNCGYWRKLWNMLNRNSHWNRRKFPWLKEIIVCEYWVSSGMSWHSNEGQKEIYTRLSLGNSLKCNFEKSGIYERNKERGKYSIEITQLSFFQYLLWYSESQFMVNKKIVLPCSSWLKTTEQYLKIFTV